MLGFAPVAAVPLAAGPLVEALRVFEVHCLTGMVSAERQLIGTFSPLRMLSGEFSPRRNLQGNVELCDDE